MITTNQALKIVHEININNSPESKKKVPRTLGDIT